MSWSITRISYCELLFVVLNYDMRVLLLLDLKLIHSLIFTWFLAQ